MQKIARAEYGDKVKGAWLGRAIGSALGAPYTDRNDLLALTYYDPIPAKAPADDAFDVVLLWIDRLKQKSQVNSHCLSQAFLNQISYTFNAYGFARRNMQLGLTPPACGALDNPYQSSSTALGRSFFWGLITPGNPQSAIELAFQDASLDHSGEGIWSSLFFSALISSIFAEADRMTLIEFAKQVLPKKSLCLKAVNIVFDGFRNNTAWQSVRDSLIANCSIDKLNAAPLMLGYILLGWLYGENDFGKALCIGVNCGYETSRVGGLLGGLHGAQIGASSIPEKWTKPVGTQVVAGWGLKNDRIPETIDELTEETIILAKNLACNNDIIRFVEHFTETETDENGTEKKTALCVNQKLLTEIHNPPAWSQNITHNDISVIVTFEEPPIAYTGKSNRFYAALTNNGTETLIGEPEWVVPEGWELGARQMAIQIPPGVQTTLPAVVRPSASLEPQASYPITLKLGRFSAVFHLLSTSVWAIAGPFPDTDGEGWGKTFAPEDHPESNAVFVYRSNMVGGYDIVERYGSNFDLNSVFNQSRGIAYLRTIIVSPENLQAKLVVACDDGVKVWLNKQLLMQYHDHKEADPSSAQYGVDIALNKGKNELLVKVINCGTLRNTWIYITDKSGMFQPDVLLRYS